MKTLCVVWFGILLIAVIQHGCTSTPVPNNRVPPENQESAAKRRPLPPAKRGYLLRVREKIDRQWNYPLAAFKYGLSGTVVVAITILPNGALERVELTKGSGFSDLDEEVLRAVRASAPFGPFPPEMEMESFQIDVSFIYEEYKPRR